MLFYLQNAAGALICKIFPFSTQIKFLKMEMEKKTKIIKDLQQEVLNTFFRKYN